MGLVSGWPVANHSNSESFLVAHTSLSQDGCQQEGFLEVDGYSMSPFDLSRTLLVGGGLLVLYSLSGSPVIKQLMQMVTMVPGQGTRVDGFNQCASLNSWVSLLSKGLSRVFSNSTVQKYQFLSVQLSL